MKSLIHTYNPVLIDGEQISHANGYPCTVQTYEDAIANRNEKFKNFIQNSNIYLRCLGAENTKTVTTN